ncbi:hypothetical protein DXT96_05895 [Agrobacterium sp. ICMP 6402]|uniref:ABC-three component system protein n=1 Tax=Agrobacterium sp. ICMP 6402 TaxID=2292443 RepID=UPI001297CCB9|nr:ABC-three component system protein [Agrobacterium sp. ICMP 6402]MQB09394.1 hypothetical protein [Agrobacterium sp. ICMP 6402]
MKGYESLAAPEIAINHMLRLATVTVPTPIRSLGGRLNLCVLQLAQSSLIQINNDQRRPAACAVLKDLLTGGGVHAGPVLRDIAPGTSPVIIVTPEYSFGHGDWAELDELIRQQQRPIVLIAGFGATPAADVQAWATEAGETARRLSWDPDSAQLSPARPINGAWCWLHGFGLDTTCAVLIKNHMEQTSELVSLEWIQAGTHLLQVSFDDLDLFPVICADMVQTFAQGEETAVHRVRAALQDSAAPDKPILITGSLVQREPSNANWAVAIDTWLHHIAPGRATLVALANVAIDSPVWPEAQDSWRSLTGAFARMTSIPKNQANLRVARGVATPSVRGAVLRLTSPYAAGGPLCWPPYGPTGEQFFWHAAMGTPLETTGILPPVLRPPEIDQVELTRFTRRAPVEETWCPRVAAGLTFVRQHIDSNAAPRAAELLAGLLHGVRVDDRCSPDKVAEDPRGAALAKAVHSLATLLTEADAFAWRSGVGQVGQLVLQGTGANILVWCDSVLSGRQIRHAVGAWAEEPKTHPPLVVLAGGQYGQIEEGPVVGHPRDNIASGPDSRAHFNLGGGLADNAGDITELRSVRSAALLRLDRLIELYVDYEAAQDDQRMADLIERLAQAAQAA